MSISSINNVIGPLMANLNSQQVPAVNQTAQIAVLSEANDLETTVLEQLAQSIGQDSRTQVPGRLLNVYA